MQVETYEMEVVSEAHPEINAESQKLIEELGLDGQKMEEGQVIRQPYPVMTKDEIFTYKILCPVEHSISNYSRTAIPLRVLQALAYCRERKIFEHYSIWDVADTSIKDPVLVGWNGYSWAREKMHIIARWGDVLDDLNVLKKKAIEIARENQASVFEQIKKVAEFHLNHGEIEVKALMDDNGWPVQPTLEIRKVEE